MRTRAERAVYRKIKTDFAKLNKGDLILRDDELEKKLELIVSNSEEPIKTLSRKSDGNIILITYRKNREYLCRRKQQVHIMGSPNYTISDRLLQEAGL